jgi:phosphate:Na+ symporter
MIQSISADNGRFVANAHTIIKVTQVIVLFPFANWIVKLASWCVPGEDKKISYRENYQLKYIGEKVVFNPATAVVEVIKELERMASLASENLNRAMNALITLDEEDIEEVYEVEKNINYLNHSITDYLVKINQSTLPIEDLRSIGALFHVANDIERIGDHAENIVEIIPDFAGNNLEFPVKSMKELKEMMDLVNKMLIESINMFVSGNMSHMNEIRLLEEEIDQMERNLQTAHIRRLERGDCSPEAGIFFTDVVSDIERVCDHGMNIAFALIEARKIQED